MAGKTGFVTLRLKPESLYRVDAAARLMGKPRSEALRMALARGLPEIETMARKAEADRIKAQ